MIHLIFDKTDKGREEIATRKYRLAARLRTLLLVVDGKKNTQQLFEQFSTLGLDEKAINELLDEGYIQEHPVEQIGPPLSENGRRGSGRPSEEITPIARDQPIAGAGILRDGETQFQALYHFFNETIRSTIGLRGYGLQLKAERAAAIEDFRELRKPYLDAVLKAKGNDMMLALRNRLDQLLYLGETPPAD
ncbi:MAG: hypothetical protein JWQ21_2286 [Herminiimonas sp.]|nr:hypothetical protein [Herminiimonas sp.]